MAGANTAYWKISATVPQARHGVIVFSSEASTTISIPNDQWFQYPMINDSNDGWSFIIHQFRAARPMSHHPSPPPSRLWNHFFGFQLRLRNLISLESPKIHLTRPKTLPKPSPRPSQNGSKIASYLPTLEILKKCNTPIRKPNFWRSQAFKNRPKIDATTLSKSASFWIPSCNLKEYNFWS